MSTWLSLTQRQRFMTMGNFRHLLQRECFNRFLSKLRNVRRLWKLAKAQESASRRRHNRQQAIDSYMEFTRGPGYDHDPERRYTREHGGHCSGGGGCS